MTLRGWVLALCLVCVGTAYLHPTPSYVICWERIASFNPIECGVMRRVFERADGYIPGDADTELLVLPLDRAARLCDKLNRQPDGKIYWVEVKAVPQPCDRIYQVLGN